MKFTFLSFLMALSLVCILSCNKETPVSNSNNVPTAPQSLIATPGNLIATLTWQAPSNIGSSAITGYNIYKGLTSGGQTFVNTVSGSVLSYIDSNLTNGTKYYYYVTALNNAGESNRSNEAYAIPRPNPTPPSVPTNVSIHSTTLSVDITWDIPLDNGGASILGYKIYKGTSSNNLALLTTVDTTSPRNYVDNAVVNYTTYYYSMTAFNSVGEGIRTNLDSVTIGYNGVIQGNVKDSTSAMPLDSVVITTTPITSTVLTNASGNYIIQGVPNGTYTVKAKKYGYYSRYINSVIVNQGTTIVNTQLLFTGVYAFNNITIQQANSSYTNLSAVDLFRGIAINEVQLNDPNKDIQMRDSAGTSTNFYLRSGDLAFDRAGSQSKFGVPLTNPKTGLPSFTKAEFDTLSYIYDFDGFSFNSYFSTNKTSSFNVFPEGSNNVYPFWLTGRATPYLQLFGVLFLRKSYIGTDGLFYLVIDVKINKLGHNLFNGNQ